MTRHWVCSALRARNDNGESMVLNDGSGCAWDLPGFGYPVNPDGTRSFQGDEIRVSCYEHGVFQLAEGGRVTICIRDGPVGFDVCRSERALPVGIHYYYWHFIDAGKYLLRFSQSAFALRYISNFSKVDDAHVKNAIVFQRLLQQ